jgi:hypothetical protein
MSAFPTSVWDYQPSAATTDVLIPVRDDSGRAVGHVRYKGMEPAPRQGFDSFLAAVLAVPERAADVARYMAEVPEEADDLAYELAPVGLREKGLYNPDLHPRDKAGKWIRKTEIAAAAADPAKARELHARVAPEDRAKLNHQLREHTVAATKKRGGWVPEVGPAVPGRNTVDQTAEHIHGLRAEIGQTTPTADHLRRLAALLAQHSVNELRQLKGNLGVQVSGDPGKENLVGGLAHRALTWKKEQMERVKADRAKRLLTAKLKADKHTGEDEHGRQWENGQIVKPAKGEPEAAGMDPAEFERRMASVDPRDSGNVDIPAKDKPLSLDDRDIEQRRAAGDKRQRMQEWAADKPESVAAEQEVGRADKRVERAGGGESELPPAKIAGKLGDSDRLTKPTETAPARSADTPAGGSDYKARIAALKPGQSAEIDGHTVTRGEHDSDVVTVRTADGKRRVDTLDGAAKHLEKMGGGKAAEVKAETPADNRAGAVQSGTTTVPPTVGKPATGRLSVESEDGPESSYPKGGGLFEGFDDSVPAEGPHHEAMNAVLESAGKRFGMFGGRAKADDAHSDLSELDSHLNRMAGHDGTGYEEKPFRSAASSHDGAVRALEAGDFDDAHADDAIKHYRDGVSADDKMQPGDGLGELMGGLEDAGHHDHSEWTYKHFHKLNAAFEDDLHRRHEERQAPKKAALAEKLKNPGALTEEEYDEHFPRTGWTDPKTGFSQWKTREAANKAARDNLPADHEGHVVSNGGHYVVMSRKRQDSHEGYDLSGHKEDVLNALHGEDGGRSLSEIREELSSAKYDPANPMVHPVHRAVKELADEGKITVGGGSDPVVRVAGNSPQTGGTPPITTAELPPQGGGTPPTTGGGETVPARSADGDGYSHLPRAAEAKKQHELEHGHAPKGPPAALPDNLPAHVQAGLRDHPGHHVIDSDGKTHAVYSPTGEKVSEGPHADLGQSMGDLLRGGKLVAVLDREGRQAEAPAKKNPFREQHEKLQREADRLHGGTPHDEAMRNAFPFGTGRPGNASSRRTSKQSDKRIDASIDRAKKAVETSKRAAEMKAKADQYDAGLIDEHGRETAAVQQKRADKQAVVKSHNEAIADHMRETLKPGDTVYLQGRPLTVQRANKTTVTTEGGVKWKYDELQPSHPTEKRPMTPKEMVETARARMNKPAGTPPADDQDGGTTGNPVPVGGPKGGSGGGGVDKPASMMGDGGISPQEAPGQKEATAKYGRMPFDKFAQDVRSDPSADVPDFMQDDETLRWGHRRHVQSLRDAGESIPDAVKAEYPDLFPTADRAGTVPGFSSEPPPVADTPEPDAGQSKLGDFGEVIGGARKHRAVPTGPKSDAAKEKQSESAAQPAWRRLYAARQDANSGKWFLTHGDKIVYGSGRRSDFATKEEAEEHIPIHAVARTHGVRRIRGADKPADTSGMDKALADGSAKITALREQHQELMFKKSFTDRVNREVEAGKMSEATRDSFRSAGKMLTPGEASKAADVERQIQAARDSVTASIPSGEQPGEEYEIYRKVTDRKMPQVKGGFKSQDEAMRHMAANPEEILNHKFPDWEDYSYLDSVHRDGPEHKAGDVSTEDFQKAFKFRGGQFGKWQENRDGQTSLNHAYHAMHDLADVTGLDPEKLSLGGRLGIAFGARGRGGKHAGKAHYEPDAEVMNLTKMKGAGSLGHEWFHALDHALAKAEHGDGTDSLLTSHMPYRAKNPEVVAAFKSLVDTMTAKQHTSAVDGDKSKKQVDYAQKNVDSLLNDFNERYANAERYHGHDVTKGRKSRFKPFTPEQKAEWDGLIEKVRGGDLGEQKYQGDGMSAQPIFDTVARLNDLYKGATGRSLTAGGNESTAARLHYAIKRKQDADKRVSDASAGATETRRGKTDYLNESGKLDNTRASDYYTLPHEMAARAFQSYVEDKLAGQGRQSDYLSAKAHNKHYAMMDAKPYPEGEEREAINAAFDKLFETVRRHYGQSD